MTHTKLFLISLVLALNLFAMSSAQSFPQSVTRHMATRQIRYHHYMWHQIRENWNRFSTSTQTAFRNIGWEPLNPSRDRSGNTINNNFAGEDFLYMHRQMIATARQVATQNRQSTAPLTGWTSIPAPTDRTYPVPDPFQRGSTRNAFSEYKTESRYQTMVRQEQRLKDTSRLRRMTLNELGIEIETGIHNNFHLRWAGPNTVGYRGGDVGSSVPNINRQWDSINYDYLADSYSSHVNPIFWKLHGWIDDRVEDWRRANGLSSIRWTGTWAGGPMANLGSVARKEGMEGMAGMDEDPEAVGDVLEMAFKIFQESGVPEMSLEEAARLDHPEKIRKVCKSKRAAL